MTERKLTDEEVIKALEKALTDVDAPIGEHWGCGFLTTQNIKDTLDLINRKNAEIGKLNRECNKQQLKRQMYRSTVDEIKAEAIKEFAEEFEKRCLASGIYPVLTKNILKNLVKELMEDKK